MAGFVTSELIRVPGRLLLLLVLCLVLAACEQPDSVESPAKSVAKADIDAINARLSRMANERAKRLPLLAETLQTAVESFLSTPTDETRRSMQDTWLATHEALSRALPFVRIKQRDDLVFAIDSWPIEPGFLDSLPDYPDSGIINDFTLTISKEMLKEQHGITDASEASLGMHPIEYYAFERLYEDFIPSGLESNQPDSKDRRREALKLMTQELVVSLNELALALHQPNQQGDGRNSTSQSLLRDVLAGSRRTATSGFQQASLIVDTDQGHCEFSGSSKANLRYEIETLRTIFAPRSELMLYLTGLDPDTTLNLDATIDRALRLLEKEEISEAERARLPLILSAIGHQLEEFERALTLLDRRGPGSGRP